jgi:FG-GAP-like repeat/Divergent InlB B-repeat domain
MYSRPLLCVLSVLVVFSAAAPRAAHAQTTALFIDSQAGDTIGGGTQWLLTPANAAFHTTNDWAGTQVWATAPSGQTSWTADFSAASMPGGPVPGAYNSTRYIGSGNRFNGLDVSGIYGCAVPHGRFVVLEAEYASDGSVVRFAADFEQHCEDRDPGLFGAVRYHSTISTLVPFGGAYPAYGLTITPSPHGRVVGGEFDCAVGSPACSTSADAPSIRTEITAVPDPGYIFAGWTGDCSGGPHATVHLNLLRACSALFMPAMPSGARTLAIIGGAPGTELGRQTSVLSSGNSYWNLTQYQNGFQVQIWWLSPRGVSDIYFVMIPPAGEVFQPGREYTATPGLSDSSRPRFGFGHDGSTCSGTTTFAVRDFAASDEGIPIRFAIDLLHQCELPHPQGSNVVTLLYNSSFDYARLSTDSGALQFSASVNAGGGLQLPAPQAIQVIASTPIAAERIVRSNQSWLVAAPASAPVATPATVSIAADVPLLPAASATGRLEVLARGAVSVIDVPVSVEVFPRPDYSNRPFAVFRAATGGWFQPNAAPHTIGRAGDIPLSGDFNGDHSPDVAVYRPSTGEWLLEGGSAVQWGLPGDIPVPADYDGNGVTDIAVFRQSSAGAQWFIRGQGAPLAFGAKGDIPVPADYDHDGRADLAVFRPRTGEWRIVMSAGVEGSAMLGAPGDIPVPADFDGDHEVDLAVFRPSTAVWYIRLPDGGTYSRRFGLSGDIPVPADVTGDGRAELRVWRPSNGMWYAYDRQLGVTTSQQYGLPGDVPIMGRPSLAMTRPADMDGDRRADVTIYRPSSGEWFTRQSAAGYVTFTAQTWGLAGDVPVPGDYDGDRRANDAVYRPATGEWFVRRFEGTLLRRSWGLPGDAEVPADYDGDGRTDMAVYRPSSGQWFILTSASDYGAALILAWGLPGDRPVPADFDGDGRADAAVYRPSTGEWFVAPSSGGWFVRQWGLPGDLPIARDFDGDGRADLAVYRPSTGEWYVLGAISGTHLFTRQWGLNGDVPVADDYDGDGVADVAVYRPVSGEWFLLPSSGAPSFVLQWGLAGDVPITRR